MYKKDFPIFTSNSDLVFLDSASSAQKPQQVIDALSRYFANNYSNIHRGAYDLSMESSLLYDRAKKAVAEKLNARADEIVFTYNATYAFNLISRSLVKSLLLQKGDRVLLSKVDHHANIVPWQILAEEYGIVIDWVELHTDGTIDYDSLREKLPGAKVLSITGASNVTGEVLDLDRVSKVFEQCGFRHREEGSDPENQKGIPQNDWIASHPKGTSNASQKGAACNDRAQKPLFILDGSQRFPHMATDVAKYGIDFYVGTGHKVMSDTGIGFFYGRKELLQKMNPAFCGGGAINSVSLEGYEAAGLPFRHEPGTPHIAGAVSFLAALEYIDSIGGYEVVEKYERELTEYALEQFSKLPSSIRLIGSKNTENRLGVFSFVFDAHHPNDVAEMLADVGICVRAGHHCTDPLHHSLGIRGSLRASLYIYNTKEDVDKLIEKLRLL